MIPAEMLDKTRHPLLLLECHTFEQVIIFPRGDAFSSQLLYIFLHDDVTCGSGYTSDS